MQLLKLPDGEMFYEEKGSGATLLFLHAGVADSRMWQPQIDFFAEHFRVVRCDLRGFGRSPYPNSQFSYVDDLFFLVKALRLEPVVVVGASFGAKVAVDFYLSFPAYVHGLVLAAPVVTGFEPSADVEQFNEHEEALLDAGKLDEATELNLQMWVDGPRRSKDAVDPALRALVAEMQLQNFAQPVPPNASLRHVAPPAIERLGEIRVPLLVVSGEHDVPSFLEFSETLAKQAPGAHRLVIPNAAHMVSMEAPTRFNQAISDFLALQPQGS